MSRVYHTPGSNTVLRSRVQIEQRLLAKVKANTGARIGTELELFVTTPDGKSVSFNRIEKLLERIAQDFKGVEKATENGRIVALHIPQLGDICLEPGGQVELSSKPCADLQELERVNVQMRAALNKAAQHFGLRVKGQGHMPSFVAADDMPRSRFAAYYRYCRHEIGRSAEELIRTMKSSNSLQINLDPMGKDFHEVYRSLMLVDVAVAFNKASQRQARLQKTYEPFFGEQTLPVFEVLQARSNEEVVKLIVDRLLTLRVPFVPDQSPEGFKSTIDVYGKPLTVGEMLKRGLLTGEILDNALSLQLTSPNLRRHGVLETRAHDSVNTTDELMRVARGYRNAAYNEAARHDLLKRFEKIDPDLLRAAFNARSTMPEEKLLEMKIGDRLTVRKLLCHVLPEVGGKAPFRTYDFSTEFY